MWRKFKVTVTGCPYWCTEPESLCLSFVAVEKDGTEGFTVFVGGGLSAVPRSAVHMPVFLRADPDVMFSFIRALVRLWLRDERYKVRHRSRIKFLVEDYGVGRLLEEIRRAGVEFEPYGAAPRSRGFNVHVGVHEQRQAGMFYVGVPVLAGLLRSQQAMELADAVEEFTEDGEIRLTVQQNVLVTNVPRERLPSLLERLRRVGFRVGSEWAACVTACVTKPYCIYGSRSIDAKALAEELVEELEARVGGRTGPLRIAVSGCVHDCARSQAADVGLRGVPGTDPPLVEVSVGKLGSRRVLGRVPVSAAKELVIKAVKSALSSYASGVGKGSSASQPRW